MTIGKKIRYLRKKQNISVDELASKLGKNRATIYRYEKGDIENLPLDTLVPLAEALNTTPAHLMGWDDNQEEATNEIYAYFETIPLERLKIWVSFFKEYKLTEKEYDRIVEYAKFIVHTRK